MEEAFQIGLPALTGLQILYTNDTHAALSRMPLLSTLVKEKRWREGPSLLLESGDWSCGDVLSERFEGMPMVEIQNAIGYDAVGLGGRDLSWPSPILARWAESAKSPLICGNLVLREGNAPPAFVKPWILRTFEDLKVAVLGVTEMQNPADPTLRVLDPEESLRALLPRVKEERPHVIILLSHLGLDAERELARLFPEIQVIVGGGSHHVLPQYLKEGNTYLLQGGGDAQYLGVFTLEMGSVVTFKAHSPPSRGGKKSGA